MTIAEKAKELRQVAKDYALIGVREGNLKLRHTATQAKPDVGAGVQRWYDVEVTLKGPESILKEVRYVEYLLHPTFSPDRVQRNTPPHFQLHLRLWGEFTLRAEVHFDQGPYVTLERYLSLPD